MESAHYPMGYYYTPYLYSPPSSPVFYNNAIKKPFVNNAGVLMQNTNIYIRGLDPCTTDESLLKLVSPFGNILSSKAILDLKSGVCKGFGFAMYETLPEAQAALESLTQQGFVVSFAVAGPRGDSVRFFARSMKLTRPQELFTQKLHELADDASTNIYISNLPLTMIKDVGYFNLMISRNFRIWRTRKASFPQKSFWMCMDNRVGLDSFGIV